MATPLPAARNDFNISNSLYNMALTQSTPKSKGLARNHALTKSRTQMHRRSRTGCYTCRLRRKKCDEGLPMCTACSHLGLGCEYKRPVWWSNNEARKKHKDDIKMIIKRKKLSEKTSHRISTLSPPGLSHSIPTSATCSDSLDNTRAGSTESHFPAGFGFERPPGSMHSDLGVINAQLHPDFLFSGYSPYEIGVKTERHMFVNDVPTLCESSVSTLSGFGTPPPHDAGLVPLSGEHGEWTHHQLLPPEHGEGLTEDGLNLQFFDFAHPPPLIDTRPLTLELDPSDQQLLEHFVRFVVPAIFPVLELNRQGTVASDLVLPALQSNKGFLHCCLSIAAQHLKSTGCVAEDEVDQTIMRHRYETVSTLCDALNRDENHQQILEAALAQILYQTVVGRYDDALPDIAWHKHFEAAISLVQRLDLPRVVADPANPPAHPPFSMTLTAWIDILGATMLGRAPTFAHTYREKLVHPEISSLGLRELMGCDDRIMYLISEIACLEALKKAGMDDITLCHHVHTLGEQIGLTEMQDAAMESSITCDDNDAPSTRQLGRTMKTAFRLAARIYLCSLVPGFSPGQGSCIGLVERLVQVVQYIPAGVCGLDSSMSWVYLMAGSVSMPGSGFRVFFQDRAQQLGDQSNLGSFGRVGALLREVWAQTDATVAAHRRNNSGIIGSDLIPHIHWRDVLEMERWDFLMI